MNHNYKTQQELLDAQERGEKFLYKGTPGPWIFDAPLDQYELAVKPAEPIIKKRKHANVIIAWANGEDVQVSHNNSEVWINTDSPLWTEESLYRVKPKEETKYYVARSNCLINSNEQYANIKMTFCGSTGDLLSVEKIK